MRANINLIHGDCMEAMKGMSDNQFDLAIVDPPYNVGASNGSFGNTGVYYERGKALKHYANHNKTPEEDYFVELFRVSTNQIIWGMNYYPQYLYHSGAIVWDKLRIGSILSDCEIAFQSFNKLVKKCEIEWNGCLKGGEKSIRIHPNQKPVALYKWLLKNYAKEGDSILDTHTGSASIALACWDLKFDLEGYELDVEYYNAAVNRFDNHCGQKLLF